MKLWVLLVGLWASLRLWLMLSFWTVVCSSLLTYFLLQQGAQLDDPTAIDESPALQWLGASQGNESVPFQLQEPTLVVGGTQPSIIGSENGVKLKLHNDGKGVLKIAVVTASCSCGKVSIDDKKLEAIGEVEPAAGQFVEIPGGKDADLLVTWTAEEKHRTKMNNFRLTVTLNVNDPRYAGRVRLEIMTPLKAPNEK